MTNRAIRTATRWGEFLEAHEGPGGWQLMDDFGPQTRIDPGLGALGEFGRGLLRIPARVTVTLAAKKQAVGEILAIAPGTILAFDKSCQELLDLEVGGKRLALGRCVKVGDKYGLRITSLLPPAERLPAPNPAAR